MATPRIEGGSAEQRRLLRRILERVDARGIDRVMVRRFDRPPEGDPPADGPVGTEVSLVVAHEDARANWAAELVGEAFAREARRLGLPKVVWLSTPDGGRNAVDTLPSAAPLDAADLSLMRRRIEDSIGDGSLGRFDVMRPLGHAVAITVSVDEPHSYLRHTSHALLGVVSEWRERCDGIYTEIRDGGPQPVLAAGWRRTGGGSSIRGDVMCCAPQLSLSRPVLWEPPVCPVFDES